jgi:hypothetical protein
MTMSWQDVYTVLKFVLVVAAVGVMVGQCRKPNGWIGGRVARAMNVGHASLTRWGLGHIALGNDFTMLDVGCGGGKLIDTLASIAPAGRLFGIDYSRAPPMLVKPTHDGLRRSVTAAPREAPGTFRTRRPRQPRRRPTSRPSAR